MSCMMATWPDTYPRRTAHPVVRSPL